jgi:hypothetical protein
MQPVEQKAMAEANRSGCPINLTLELRTFCLDSEGHAQVFREVTYVSNGWMIENF